MDLDELIERLEQMRNEVGGSAVVYFETTDGEIHTINYMSNQSICTQKVVLSE